MQKRIFEVLNKAKVYMKEKGFVESFFHAIEKIKWSLQKNKFGHVGVRSYVQSPYDFCGESNICIGDRFTARRRLRLETYEEHNGKKYSPKIIIGNDVSFNYDVHIGAINKIVIEDGVLLASKVFITDHNHGQAIQEELWIPPSSRDLWSKGPVYIKQNAWIGEGVAVLPGVTIGENSIIGANSVVTKDIPDNCIAAGNPAKIIKTFTDR